MKFGIFVFGDNPPKIGRSNQKYYEEVLTMAEWAEELGFDSFWLGEHHFYWYGTCVSPPMVIAALGQRTKKIRLGPAVAVPAFHNPLVLAEEYAFADNLCGGRLDFGLGSGFSPVEFKTFGITIEEAKERFWEATDVILKAWRQDEFSHQGKYYQFDNVSLYMKPLQKPMRPTSGFPLWAFPLCDRAIYSRSRKRMTSSGNLIFGPAIKKIRISSLLCTFACNGAKKTRLS